MTAAQSHPLVSVLVPVYNMAAYLPKCMEALCSQSLDSLEIIAINDGSTDASPEILRFWADRDPRVKVITKPNSGYGASMNRGLAAAQGTYVGIVEPDDYPDLVMFQKLVRAAERTNADVVKCNYYLHFEDHEDIAWNFRGFPYGKLFDPADKPSIICTPPAIWAGLYRRSFLMREGIRFRETPGAAFQDTAFSLKVWFAAQRAVLVRRPLLHYRMDNPGSSSKTTDKVFTVNDELAEARAFLAERPSREAVFAPWFNVDKWGKYRWNFERIAISVRQDYLERVRAEYEQAWEAGDLDLGLFESNSAGQLAYLLNEGAEAFLKKYPDGYPLDTQADEFARVYLSYVKRRGDFAAPNRAAGAPAAAAAPAAGNGVAGGPATPDAGVLAVSVIVPVCNSTPFVGECLESLKAQTFSNFEAIVVDDASTDGSLDVVRELVSDDSRFTVVACETTEGPSAARNKGLDRARGEYVVFLDSDDYLTRDALEKLVRRARMQDLDELYFSGETFYESDELRERLHEDFGSRTAFDGVLTGRELFVFFEERGQFFTQATLRMVRRRLIEDNNIRFREGILHEDILFTFQTLVAAQRSSFLDEPLYQRRLHERAIMGSKRTIANIDGRFVSLQAIKRWLHEHVDELDDDFAAAVAKQVAEWREMVAHDWNTDILSEDRAAYLKSLAPADRVDFYCDIIGSGAGGDRVREEYSKSRAYQLGNALVTGSRMMVERARELRANLGGGR